MAEVTGDIGGQSVILNNAATEATLREILRAIGALNARLAAKGGGTGKDYDAELNKLSSAARKAAASGTDFAAANKRSYKAMQEQAKAAENAAEKTNKLGEAADLFVGTLSGAITKTKQLINYIGNTTGALANMGDSLTGAVDALGNIPLGMGDVIAGVFKPVAAAVESTHKAFLDASSVGANFGGNMNEMLNSTAAAGMTLDQFSGIVKQNGENLMYLGGSTDEGAKRLAKFGKEIRNSELGNDLARLGYSTTAINDGFARYTGMLGRTGKLTGKSDEELRKGTAEYLKNLDAVSKLTGKTKESLQAEQDARMADAQYRAMYNKLDEEGQRNMQALMDSIPKQHQAGLKEILATGTATSKAGEDALAFLQRSGQSAMALHRQMESTGTISKQQVLSFNKTYQDEAKAMAKSPIIDTLAKFDPAANDFVIGIYNVGARTKDLATVMDENEKRLQQLKDKEIPDLLDPADIQRFKQNIANWTVDFTKDLANIDLKPMEEMFGTAMNLAKDYLVPALETAADNIKWLTLAVGAATAAVTLFGAAVSAKGLLGRIGNVLGGKGGPGFKPPASAGAGAANATRSGANVASAVTPGGKSVVGNIAKKAGVVGTIAYGAYEGYTGYTEAEEKLQRGEITENQATVEKSEAVAGAVGGTSGALGGASAGAAIGTMFLPGIGTAIGGLIGGAIGWWGGQEGGKAIGGVIGEALAGPDTIRDLEAKAAKLKETIAEGTGVTNWSIDDEKEELAQIEKQLQQARMQQLKAEAAANSSPVTNPNALPSSPVTSSPVNNVQKSLEADAEARKKAEAEKKAKEAEAAKKKAQEMKEKNAAPDGAEGASVQKNKETSLATLNSNIEELVRLTRAQLEIGQRQLSVSQGMSGDLFVTV